MELAQCVCHAVKAGRDPAELLRQYRGRVKLVHCKDYLPGEGEDILTPTGQGMVDWSPVLAACRETGVPYVLAEQERWDKDPFLCAQESLEYLWGQGLS